MIRANPIKSGLKAGKKYVGTFAKMHDPCVAELLALAGLDFFIVDNEHSQMSKENMLSLVRTADISGIVPIVRVRENSRAQILQALDAGALGVMVPETNSAAEVRHVVECAFYAPLGGRGYTASSRAAGYGTMDPAAYAAAANGNVMTLVYCETQAAIDSLDEMLAVPNVDVMWIGPMDLTQSLGVIGQPAHPKVTRAVETVVRRCLEAKVAVGTIASDAAAAARLFDMGVQLISVSSDQAMVIAAGKRIAGDLAKYR